jgi:ABC-type sugar transport system substrate-binding protein
VDGATGTEEAVEHIYRLGHRRIAYLGWPVGSGVGEDRLAGYHRACARLGLAPVVVRAEDGMERGRERAAALLDAADPPSALVCVSDVFAYGALRALAERGLRPGADVAVAGFDDTPAAGLPGVELTSVAQPIEAAGRTVVRLLLGALGVLDPGVLDPGVTDPGALDPGALDPGATPRELLRPSLTIRASTGPPASGRAPVAGTPTPTRKETPCDARNSGRRPPPR